MANTRSIYLIGALKNQAIPDIANRLRQEGFAVYDDWFSPGPEADERWREYEGRRGRTYKEALSGYHARDVFELDKRHLDRCDVGVLVLPAGRSGHLELGYMIGQRKPGYVLFDQEPERYDIMYALADAICFSIEELVDQLQNMRERGER